MNMQRIQLVQKFMPKPLLIMANRNLQAAPDIISTSPSAGDDARKRQRPNPSTSHPTAQPARQHEQDEDHLHRQRIMNFAQSIVVPATQMAPQADGQGAPRAMGDALTTPAGRTLDALASRRSPPTQPESNPLDLRNQEFDEAARQRIMAMASEVNANRGGIRLPPSTTTALRLPLRHVTDEHRKPESNQQQSNNALLAQLHAELRARRGVAPQARAAHTTAPSHAQVPAPRDDEQAPTASRGAQQEGDPRQRLTILSYNVWFREDVELGLRMRAIAEIISEEDPDVICLQEVTPNIYFMLREAPWWSHYTSRPVWTEIVSLPPYFTALLWKTSTFAANHGYASTPFHNSRMARGLQVASLTAGGLKLQVATSHLESPTGRHSMHSEQRVAQAKNAMDDLDSMGDDCVYIGDMNWNESNDGPAPLPPGWVDAWVEAHPGEPGYTYDASENPMLARRWTPLRLRLDRAWVKLQRNWKLASRESVQLVGREALPSVRFEGRPVLPSDHYGLLLKLESGGQIIAID